MGKLFSLIVAGRERMPQQPAEGALSERDNRLRTQLIIRSYDTVLHARKLQEASREHLFAVINLAGWSIFSVLALLVGAVVAGSWNAHRLVSDRIARLQEGAAAIGEGNLDHRINLQGDDEFAELSQAFDSMTTQLHRSYRDLEREVGERRLAEKALRESEARFRGTFENAAVGISLFDQEGKLIQANGRLCEILGYTEAELQGRVFNSFTHPEDFQPDRGRFDLLIRGELGGYEVEKRYIRKDGSHVWVRVSRWGRQSQSGLLPYSISVVQDINARKEAEERLHHANALLRTVMENTPDFIYIKDRQGRMLMANPATLQYLGRSFEEVIGRTDEELLGERPVKKSWKTMVGSWLAARRWFWRKSLTPIVTDASFSPPKLLTGTLGET